MNVKSRKLSIRELSAGGLFAALIAVGAFIRITLPTEPVPMHITLQWFFVLLAGLMLNKRLAAASVGVYLLIGLTGVPVFAAGGGPSYLLRPTFGYLLGFAAAAYVMAWLCERFRTLKFLKLLLISVAGLLVYYGIGIIYYFFVCRFLVFQEVTWKILLVNGFLLTAGADFILCAAAAGAAVKLRGVMTCSLALAGCVDGNAKQADTGDASRDDPRNQDEIGENEILVVSFGTSFNDSRADDIKGIEDAMQEANPGWSVRRAFTSQIIINHVQARDGEAIDNVEQALGRAAANKVKNLVVQPTHLMHGAEYDKLVKSVKAYQDQFETVKVAEPLLGETGSDISVINADKEAVAKALTGEAVKEAGYESLDAAKEDSAAFVFLGHGTYHTAKVSYSQMQSQMGVLGYDNVYIGTVEGDPVETACEAVIKAVGQAGYRKVVLRPLMVVAGDHANNDMAGDTEDSWKSSFLASGKFDSVDVQILGLGSINAIQQIYVEHAKAAMNQ